MKPKRYLLGIGIILLFVVLLIISITTFSQQSFVGSTLSTTFSYTGATGIPIQEIYRIGNHQFTPLPPTFTCNYLVETRENPGVVPECYSTSLDGLTLALNTPSVLSKYIQVESTLQETDVKQGVIDDFQGQFKFTLDTKAIDLQNVDYLNILTLNQDRPIKLNIMNNLYDDIKLIVNWRQTGKIVYNVQKGSQEYVLKAGTNSLALPLKYDQLGTSTISIELSTKLYDYGVGLTSQNTGLCFVDSHKQKQCVQEKVIPLGQSRKFDILVLPEGADVQEAVKTYDYQPTISVQQSSSINWLTISLITVVVVLSIIVAIVIVKNRKNGKKKK